MEKSCIELNKIMYTKKSKDGKKGGYPFIIIKEVEPKVYNNGSKIRMCLVKFLNTGYECIKDLSSINKGEIKDPYEKSIYGVACIGNSSYKNNIKIYAIWKSIICKCYDKLNNIYKHNESIGIKRTVCDRWLCFEYFLEDISNFENFDKLMNSEMVWGIGLKDKKYTEYNNDTIKIDMIKNFNIARLTNNKNNSKIKYYGIKKSKSGNYEVSIRGSNGKKKNFGTFSNIDAAGTVANYYFALFDRGLYNDTGMSLITAYHYKSRPKAENKGQMYHLIDNSSLSYDEYKNINKQRNAEVRKEKMKIRKQKLIDNRDNIPFDKIFISDKYGSYKIIELIAGTPHYNPNVKIKFDSTGYETIVSLSAAVNLNVRDPYYPSICGFGYTGEVSIPAQEDDVVNILYGRWRLMIDRCYNPNNAAYSRYGGIGIKVSNEWAYFWNYYNDIIHKDNFNELVEDPSSWEIDKDFLQQHIPMCNRIYSNDTTVILNYKDNYALRIMQIQSLKNNKYDGVYMCQDGYYETIININGHDKKCGKYITAEAAATIYDHYSNMYNHKIINNTNISIDDAIRQSVNYGKKVMYRLI